MKVILQRQVDKLGAPGDVVDVADGYGRNFLIPKGLAVPATRGGVKHADRLRSRHQARIEKETSDVRALADRLVATGVRIPARAGEDGRLFGSITAADVAAELAKAGAPVDRREIRLDDPIRSVGTHEVVVHLHPDVDATVTIEVVPE